MVSAVSGNLVTGEVVYDRDNDALARGWDNEIRVVLEAIARFEQSRTSTPV